MTADDGSRPYGTAEEFAAFVAKHYRYLGRLAYLLQGDEHAAEDLTADVLLAAWRQWARVREIEFPLAYLRQVMTNMALAGHRRTHRERRGLERLGSTAAEEGHEPDGAAVLDVRSALLRLPPRRRACLVLRFEFDLTEREVAQILGVSVGTVKSQTYKAAQQFRNELASALVETHEAVERTTAGSGPGDPRHAD